MRPSDHIGLTILPPALRTERLEEDADSTLGALSLCMLLRDDGTGDEGR